MRHPFICLVIAPLLWCGSIAAAPAQSAVEFGCDSRSGCTYPVEAAAAQEAEVKPKAKRKRTPTVINPSPPITTDESMTAAVETETSEPKLAVTLAPESIIPVALALSLTFAPPPLPEPRLSPTTCLLDRAFGDVHVADAEDGRLKPRLFERGIELLAARASQTEPALQTH